jgi:hypothetical protein
VNEEGRHAKGRSEAEQAFAFVRDAFRQNPELTRREAREGLMYLLSGGSDALFLDGQRRKTRDPAYKNHYDRVSRRYAVASS